MENKTTTSIILIVVVLLGAYFLFFNNETWLGFYYPDEDNLTNHTQSPELKSLEECHVWVNSQVQIHDPSGSGYDYECGKNCKFDKDYGLYVCKETLN
tara:strand:+ start:3375 stop:3668 length:294 start_codon:yes stop_codon:yes gene_type:complete